MVLFLFYRTNSKISMDKLIVSLPGVRRSIKNIKRSNTEQNKASASKERVRKYEWYIC
jgi:hypothetical protein